MWTFEALIEPDDRSLRFTSMGFAMGGRLTPQSATSYQHRLVDASLAPEVPDVVRSAFGRLQRLQVYGVLEYDLFTVAAERSLFVADLALSMRFMEWCGGLVHRREQGGEPEAIAVQNYEDVYRAFRGKFRLLLDPKRDIPFNGGFSGLIRWARALGFLYGQQNRRRERYWIAERNHAAHPRWHSILTPTDSAKDVGRTSELINRLWGHDTPGGRHYPGPIAREPMIIGWDEFGVTSSRATNTGWFDDDLTYVVVLADPQDPFLHRFHTHFELTAHPVDLLAGPMNAATLRGVLSSLQAHGDRVATLDRLFACEIGAGPGEWARRPEVAAAISVARPETRWHLVRADYAGAATHHARQAAQRLKPCRKRGPCKECAAETVGVGTWPSLRQFVDVAPSPLTEFGLPSRF